MRARFGEFTFDTGRQELTRGDEPVHITPKAMQLLEALIEKRPDVISRRELFDRLWPDVVVHDANLKNLVADLRAALDDHEREGRFLRTVHGRGYAFCGELVEVSKRDEERRRGLVIFHHGLRRIVLRGGESIIGRGDDADEIIDDPEVSRHHARVVIAPDTVSVEDLSSRNGTFVGGVRIMGKVELRDGDELRIGPAVLTVKILRSSDETQSAK